MRYKALLLLFLFINVRASAEELDDFTDVAYRKPLAPVLIDVAIPKPL